MSVISSDKRSVFILCLSFEWFKKDSNASAVVANPPGTLTPWELRPLIISPREAFLPPTFSTSDMPTSLSQTTFSFIKVLLDKNQSSYSHKM